MKNHRIIVIAAFAAMAFSQAQAEEYQGVLQTQSTLDRSAVKAQAVAAAHASDPYADGASSVATAAPVSPRDRASVQAEARARAHAPNQNLRVEAFAGSQVPDYYGEKATLTRQSRAESGTTAR